MYLEEKLMNISKVFQFLVQVYSVESSSFFYLRNIGVYICVERYGPQKKKLFLLLLLIEPPVYSGVNGGRASSHDSKKARSSLQIIVPCQHLWNCCWHTNTTRGFTFQVSTFEILAADGCTDWRRFCKGFCYLQMPILGFFVLLSPYTRSHILFACG